ncbi:MAG: glycosyltransferase [Candidatus Eisenbacteria bacterium]|nr:glycosyltransferase [Candidatus Eisenbacteria bacterium]
MSLGVTLVGHYPPPFGGVATLLTQMESALQSAGCRVEIFNLGHGRPDGANVTSFDTSNRMREVLELRSAVAASDSDVFHYISASYRSFWLGSVFATLTAMQGRRLVMSFVGGAFPDFIATLSPVKRWWARATLSRAAALVACNDEIAEVLGSFRVRPEIHRITNSFPMTGEGEPLPEDVETFVERHSPVVSTTGAAAPEYGLTGAVRAISDVRERRPDVGFVMVLTRYGTDEHEAEIVRAIEEEDLESNVFVTRGLPDFTTLLGRSDVFLRSTLVDGDSMSVREALATGLPTVASDTAFRPEGVIEYRKGDVDDMASKLEHAFDRGTADARLAREEGERNLEALLEVYRSVVDGATRGAA